jgi:hypothetical protein
MERVAGLEDHSLAELTVHREEGTSGLILRKEKCR